MVFARRKGLTQINMKILMKGGVEGLGENGPSSKGFRNKIQECRTRKGMNEKGKSRKARCGGLRKVGWKNGRG